MSTAANKKLNVLLITDNTGSMGEACRSARDSFEEIRTQLSLLMGGECVDVAVIGDYDSSTPNNHQGGWTLLPKGSSPQQVASFMSTYVKPIGGGGHPEAYKTGFNQVLRLTPLPDIVFMFCDAIPHGVNGASLDREGLQEKAYIDRNNMIWDWEQLCSTVKGSNIRVVTFLTANTSNTKNIWGQMGDIVCMGMNTSQMITKAMLWTFNALTDQPRYTPSPSEFTLSGLINPIVKIDLANELKNADPATVINAFDRLLDVSVPARAMCLTTNDILGKYWRLICGKYKYIEDRKYAAQCQRVMDKLSYCKDRLSDSDKKILKEWIDRSHNDTPIIREIVQRGLDNTPIEFLVLPDEMVSSLTLDDVLELGRGGGFGEVAKLIASLKLVPASERAFVVSDDEEVAPDFIPMTLSRSTIFRLVANLLSPGLMFSVNESFLVAILALKNKYLAEIAHTFLSENIGKWIKWDLDTDGKQLFPVFWSMNFMRLLTLAPNDVLTPKEIEFRDHYLRVAKVVRNHDATIQIVVPLMFDGLRSYVTWKRPCLIENGGCGQDRCFTLFPGDSSVCALCINKRDNDDELYSNPSKIRDKDSHKANWAQCHTCTANYTVSCPERLNVRPKCHNCRSNITPENIECCACLNKYVNHAGSAVTAMNDAIRIFAACSDEKMQAHADTIRRVAEANEFICPRCIESPSDMVKTLDVKITELITENHDLINLIPIGPYTTMMNSRVTFWKRVLDSNALDAKTVAQPSSFKRLMYRDFSVHNPTQVAEEVQRTLLDHSGTETCQMCVMDVPVRSIVPACGNCPNRVCESCVKSWYSQVQIGHLVQSGHCLCPFCKTPPVFNTVRGLDVRHIRNLRPTQRNKGQVCVWDPRSVYGVCIDCLNLRVAMPRECARGELPDVRNFVCDDCRVLRESRESMRTLAEAKSKDELNLKPCPNCHAETERSGGCHHITCHCGAHWCWVCGQGAFEDGTLFDEHTVYDHMADCGGIFPGDLHE